MTPGTVLHHDRFEFQSGGFGRKYLVVLNDGACGYYILAKTTSNPKNKTSSYGCNSKDIYPNFFLPDGRGCLRGDSWVCLNEFYEFTRTTIISGGMSGVINNMGCLVHGVQASLISCAIHCDDISVSQIAVLDDVLKRHFPPV